MLLREYSSGTAVFSVAVCLVFTMGCASAGETEQALDGRNDDVVNLLQEPTRERRYARLVESPNGEQRLTAFVLDPNRDFMVRLRGINLLALLRGRTSEYGLRALLHDEDPVVRCHSIQAIIERKLTSAVPDLREKLDDQEPCLVEERSHSDDKPISVAAEARRALNQFKESSH